MKPALDLVMPIISYTEFTHALCPPKSWRKRIQFRNIKCLRYNCSMKIKRRTWQLLPSLVLLFVIGSVSAGNPLPQSKSPEEREIFILKEVPDENLAKEFKPEDGGDSLYRKTVADHNLFLKEATEKLWIYNRSNVTVMTASEIEKLKNKKTPDKLVLYCVTLPDSKDTNKVMRNFNPLPGMGWKKNFITYHNDDCGKQCYTYLVLTKLEDFNTNHPFAVAKLGRIVPYRIDIYLGFLMMKENIFSMIERANPEKLKPEQASILRSKKILFCGDDIDLTLTGRMIKTVYPFRLEAGDQSRVDAMLMSDNPDYCIWVIRGESTIIDVNTKSVIAHPALREKGIVYKDDFERLAKSIAE